MLKYWDAASKLLDEMSSDFLGGTVSLENTAMDVRILYIVERNSKKQSS
jgi:hypothetical protein